MYLGEAGCSASYEPETMLGCTAWKYDRYDFGSAWLPYSMSCTVVLLEGQVARVGDCRAGASFGSRGLGTGGR